MELLFSLLNARSICRDFISLKEEKKSRLYEIEYKRFHCGKNINAFYKKFCFYIKTTSYKFLKFSLHA